MRTLLLSITLLLTLQASDCATAGSVQDSTVTKAKREADADVRPTPTLDMTLPAYNPTHPYTDPATGVYIKNMWNEGRLRVPDRNKDIPPGMRPMTEAEVDAELRKERAR